MRIPDLDSAIFASFGFAEKSPQFARAIKKRKRQKVNFIVFN